MLHFHLAHERNHNKKEHNEANREDESNKCRITKYCDEYNSGHECKEKKRETRINIKEKRNKIIHRGVDMTVVTVV